MEHYSPLPSKLDWGCSRPCDCIQRTTLCPYTCWPVEQQAASVSDYTLFPNQSLLSVSESAYSHGVLLPIRLILLHQLCELVSSSSPPNYLCSSLSLDDRIFQLFQLPSTCWWLPNPQSRCNLSTEFGICITDCLLSIITLDDSQASPSQDVSKLKHLTSQTCLFFIPCHSE